MKVVVNLTHENTLKVYDYVSNHIDFDIVLVINMEFIAFFDIWLHLTVIKKSILLPIYTSKFEIQKNLSTFQAR